MNSLLLPAESSILLAGELSQELRLVLGTDLTVVAIDDGKTSTAFAEVHRPPVIISDMLMNGCSSFLMLERLRLIPGYDFQSFVLNREPFGGRHESYLRMLGAETIIAPVPRLTVHRIAARLRLPALA